MDLKMAFPRCGAARRKRRSCHVTQDGGRCCRAVVVPALRFDRFVKVPVNTTPVNAWRKRRRPTSLTGLFFFFFTRSRDTGMRAFSDVPVWKSDCFGKRWETPGCKNTGLNYTTRLPKHSRALTLVRELLGLGNRNAASLRAAEMHAIPELT